MNRLPKVLTLLVLMSLFISLGLENFNSSSAQAAGPASAQAAGAGKTGITSLAVSPDGKLLAGGNEGTQIDVWDVSTGQLRQTLAGHAGAAVTKVAFSPDGKTLASAGRDSTIRLWDVATGKQLRLLRGHDGAVLALAFSPDGQTLVSGGEDTRILVWQVTTGKLLNVLSGHTDFVSALAFSRDGKQLASASQDTRLKIWDLATGHARATLRGHSGPVTDVAFSPDGTSLASSSSDKSIRLWDVASGTQRQILRGTTQKIRTVAFSPDGKTLISGSDDNSITLWDAKTGQVRRSLKKHTNAINGVAFTPDGTKFVSGSEDNQIIVWDAATSQQTRTFHPSASPKGTAPLTNAAPSLNSSTSPSLSASAALALGAGPGGPILVITTAADPFSAYYAEILRNEGLNEFATADIGTVTAATLSGYDVVVLAHMPLSAGQVTMFSDWVNAGGNLIAMQPDKQLAALLGLTDAAGSLTNGYLLVDTTTQVGNGIVNQTIQFHGSADRYALNGAASLATLYASAVAATANPAVTLRAVGSGHAAAFVYDLARSIVYTRQGNPAWSGQERDGVSPIRSDDLYYGAAAADPQTDWVDLSKALIPQADEQQRLLANLILNVNQAKKPLPRFWYLPRGLKAVVVMTGDDHANGGTAGRFDQYIADSPANCNVANWECVRGTSYVEPGTPLSNAQAAAYNAQGFEIGAHISTNCLDWTPASLESFFAGDISSWTAQFPSLPAMVTNRTHCIAWSDWATQPQVELNHNIRLDANYYYWPPSWITDRPGFFTGSGMPMRFAGLDGSMIDVYQAATQMTDESGQSYPYNINTLLDNALGATGYYGVFTVNAHTDVAASSVSDAVVASAQARAVPVITSRQMLTWLDGRNNSSFSSLAWNGTALSFSIAPAAGANGLQALVPWQSAAGVLTSLTFNNSPVSYSAQAIKGVTYAAFLANAGSYVATYAVDNTPPTVVSTTPANGATGVSVTSVSATFSEPIDPTTVNPTTFELRNPANTLVPATVSYDAANNKANLVPLQTLTFGTTYTATVKGGATDPRVKDLAGNALANSFTWTFTTAAGPACPCSIWSSSAAPQNASVNDPNAVELGVKFQSDFDGQITGIRFYKGSTNTGAHVGSLWTSGGSLLAEATFSNESTTGWQQVSFAAPVAISANTVYVASYHTNAGNYAGDNNYFAGAGVDNAPLHALRDGVSGGDGLYVYGGSAFPNNTYQSSNYWVDVVFTLAGPDTTPPTVTNAAPANGATGVSKTTTVAATFSEALDSTTVNTTTFQLVGPSNVVVPATVSYDSNAHVASLAPNSPLSATTTYTATIQGGATAPHVTDLSGNALAANYTWSFTTAAPPTCPCSIWSSAAAPQTASDPDASAVELGVKFKADADGQINGIRFYKGNTNTGTHVGSLWTNTGTLLAQATFSNESASGWQQVSFGAPVAISANTVYVASYHTTVGHYAADSGYFGNAGVDNAPLHALRDGVSGSDGVYIYSAGSAFPNSTFQATNYWVDVIYAFAGPDTTPPTVTGVSPANGVTGVPKATSVAATFSEALDAATINGTTFQLFDPSNAVVPAAVSYDSNTHIATLAPSAPLSATTTYTAVVTGGSVDPRVKDLAGNALVANYAWSFTTALNSPCDTPANPIVAENCLPGNPASEWDISGSGDTSIQGFGTDISVNRGNTISFKINTDATNYRLDIYRMGYYGGLGARKITTVLPSATLPQIQPACLTNAASGLIDCGNWGVSASWAVPANAVSGIYFARLVRTDTGGASHIVFVVRDDASTSDVLFQTSDTTWEAYNQYGGNSLYVGGPGTNPSRAYKVSYNRPFDTRGTSAGEDFVFNAEYPMVRWLESNGYNTSYFTGVDTDRNGALITRHKVFLTVGHDEYWSGGERTNVEAARAAGVNLAFFTGNEIFWKTRWENSIDGSGTAYRTLVSYKETHNDARIDPLDVSPTWTWTGSWMDPRFSPPSDGGRPQNGLSGNLFMVNDGPGATTSIVVPAADGRMRFWRNTSLASLAAGSSYTFPNGTLGYEWDEDLDNGFRPAGMIHLSTTTVNNVPVLQDYGHTYANDTATHNLTLYRASSGALVFGAGTVQWSWGLDSNHDRGSNAPDVGMQQATMNLFADMNVQPVTLQSGLVAATASTDAVAPTSTITAPANGANFPSNTPITISGTAIDAGGGVVGGVEVSVDGGLTWHPAVGRGNWSYTWTPAANGALTIESRAVDDSGNLETPSAGVTITVGSVVSTATATSTSTTTSTPTQTATPAASNTPTSTATATSTTTSTPTQTATPAVSNTPTSTATATSTSTATVTPTQTATPTASNTPTVTATATNTPTATPTNTPTATPANSAFFSPSANGAVTVNAGDNNGYETNPTRAYALDGQFAQDANSGTSNSTSCTNAGKDKHLFFNYGISIPGATVTGLTVQLNARVNGTAGAPSICVQLSWDGGTTWTAAQSTPTLTTSNASYLLGGSTNTWGHAWTTAQLSNANFRVRVIDVASNTTRTFMLDWVAVQVSYR